MLPQRFHTGQKVGHEGDISNGRGGFRTCDLSRVKRALSH
jgi:hypothetical protein